MDIAIDARYWGRHLSGIGRYAQTLLRGIHEADASAKIAVVVRHRDAIPAGLGAAWEWVIVDRNPFGPWQQTGFPGLMRKLGVKLLHSVDTHAPLRGRFRRVVTFHDLIPLVYRDPAWGSIKARWPRLWKWWLGQQAAAADRIMTGSFAARADIERIVGVDREKISVIPPGTQMRATAPVAPDVLREQFGLHGQVVLMVGRRDPYKNLLGGLRAFARLRDQVSEPIFCVIVGHVDPRHPEPEVEAARLGVADAVVFTDHIADAELIGLYQLSDVFLFPSLFEGYGLPVLEAMACGVPVVATNRTSVPEVVQEAGLLMNPEDPDEMAAALLRVLRDPTLAAELRARGLQRAAEASPARQGAACLRLYDEMLTTRK